MLATPATARMSDRCAAVSVVHDRQFLRRVTMRRRVLALALTLAAVGGPLLAQEEPPLFENPPAPEEPSASPTPPAALSSAPPASPLGPLPAAQDFARWRVMTARERQTYVEGAITSIGLLTGSLRTEVISSKGIPREGLTSVVRFVNLNSPRRGPATYLKEMERIYMTAEGQKLTMAECFHLAFERLNVPAAVAPPPPQAAKTPGAPADQ